MNLRALDTPERNMVNYIDQFYQQLNGLSPDAPLPRLNEFFENCVGVQLSAELQQMIRECMVTYNNLVITRTRRQQEDQNFQVFQNLQQLVAPPQGSMVV